MSSMTIECPQCHTPFELTEALASPLLEAERKKVDAEVTRRVAEESAAVAKAATEAAQAEAAAKLKASEAALAEKDAKLRQALEAELAIRKEREQLEQFKRELDLTVQRRVDAEKKVAAEQAAAAVAAEYISKLKATEAALAERDAKIREAQEAELKVRAEREKLEQDKREVELTVQRRVDAEKKAAAEQAAAAAEAVYKAKLEASESAVAEKDAKLKAAEEAELRALKLKQEAEDAKRQAELEVARRLDEERAKVREQASRERDEEYRLKMAEKDKQIADIQQKLDEARRKGERGPQQLVGDVLERELVSVLSAAFPDDEFEQTKKGQSGADLVQKVRNRGGRVCGRILWESKRTKTWQDGWLGKLRDDQRAIKADIAALVSETLPRSVNQFDILEGVWVAGVPTAVAMAAALRHGLIETATARQAAAGAETAKDLVYGYLTGPEFRQRVRGAIEPIVEMRADLDRERRLMTKQWSAREKQIERITNSMAGMYGDLQGIAGSSLPAVEGLMMPELVGPAEEPTPSGFVGSEAVAANDH